MSGHGTVVSGADAQGTCTIYVSDNGGSGDYSAGSEQSVVNNTGGTLNPGNVVVIDWNGEAIQANATGAPAKGDVDSAGRRLTIVDSGDTGLSGTINISSSYGNNSGFNGETDINCGNVNGEASYLC